MDNTASEKIQRLERTIERMRVALEESGKTQVYYDGFEAALSYVRTLKVHVTWGPDAHPDNGLEFMQGAVIEGLEDSLHYMKTGKHLARPDRVLINPDEDLPEQIDIKEPVALDEFISKNAT